MERHGRAGETSEPKSHPINESPDRSKSTSYKNILGSEITAIDFVPSRTTGLFRDLQCCLRGPQTLGSQASGHQIWSRESSFSQLWAGSRTYKSLKGWSKALFSNRNPPNALLLPSYQIYIRRHSGYSPSPNKVTALDLSIRYTRSDSETG
ncbi:hypothetical protein BN1723_003023 [Verticillium longisporum]|uniref:Uncharacterized protein n=1 Tax=Verticillium longisporum TaxID=100787 RepID=A0A0G4LMR8_VERLO|nr:hypothetical protein BN1723_003023 [Verticillium longisporum]